MWKDVKKINRFKMMFFSILLTIACGMDLHIKYESEIKRQIKLKLKSKLKN